MMGDTGGQMFGDWQLIRIESLAARKATTQDVHEGYEERCNQDDAGF